MKEFVITVVFFATLLIFFLITILTFALGEWQASIAASFITYLLSRAFVFMTEHLDNYMEEE